MDFSVVMIALAAAAMLGGFALVPTIRGAGWPVLVALGLALAAVPFGMVVTVVLFPFWRWLEKEYGIEAVGHSGPAEWCYGLTTIVTVVLFESLYIRHLVRRRAARWGIPPQPTAGSAPR